MEYNVLQLLKEPVGSTRSFEVDDEFIDEDGTKYKLTGSAEFLRTNRSILVRAKFQAITRCVCSRCLKNFPCSLPIDFEEEFFPTIHIYKGTQLTSPDEPGSFTIDNKHVLSLKEAMREYILINMPMRPLCREDCSGLCPICGHNLNEGPCLCKKEPVDSRWAPLLALSSKVSRKAVKKGI